MAALADDVARLRQVLNRQSGPTIVAGHSYGGQIMTALGTDAPNVVGLVYIAAFGLDEGESIGAPPTQAEARSAALEELVPAAIKSLAAHLGDGDATRARGDQQAAGKAGGSRNGIG